MLRRTIALAAALLAVARAAPAQEGTWALTNARIETVTRGTIGRGTIVIRDGLITAVGANVPIPPDARVVDLASRTVYPGLIDLTSTLGLPVPAAPTGGSGRGGPPGPVPATPASGPSYVGLEASRTVADELQPAATDVKAVRDAGITAVLVAPGRGAFRGMSALLPLRDSVTGRDVIRAPVALHMGFESAPGRYPGTLLGVIAYERQAFYDAQRQGLMMDRYAANPRGMERPAHDANLDALVPVVRGTLPAFFAANSEREIRRAMNIAREFHLKMTIVGATEAFRALDALGGQPVIVSVNFPQPTDASGWSYRASQRQSPRDSIAAVAAARKMIEGNAAALNKAGIKFAFASGGARGAEFLGNVRKAVAAGLPRDVAIQALTIRPAEIAGAGQTLGSIEPGKIANLVITDGDLLAENTHVKAVFVDGGRYEVTTPPPAAPARAVAGRNREGGDRPAERPGEGVPVALSGTWTVTVNTPQGSNPSTMTLTQNGTAFTGTMVSEQIGSQPITDGQINGKTATWSISFSMGGQALTATFRGEIDGNRMTGTAGLGAMGSATFTAERNP